MVASAGAKSGVKKRDRSAYEELTDSSGHDGDTVDGADGDTPPPNDTALEDKSSMIKKKRRKRRNIKVLPGQVPHPALTRSR